MNVHPIFRILLFAVLAALMTAPLSAMATNPGDPPPDPVACPPIEVEDPIDPGTGA